MTWRYVIMANGSGTRWRNHQGVPKHLYVVEGETLLARLARQLRELGCEDVIISASDPRLEIEGIPRHQPVTNEIELDRFVPELITSNICFLYGDTYYTDATLLQVVAAEPQVIEFFATDRSIIAVKSGNEEQLYTALETVRADFNAGRIANCRGWELYDAYVQAAGAGSASGAVSMTPIGDRTGDINTPADALRFASVLSDV